MSVIKHVFSMDLQGAKTSVPIITFSQLLLVDVGFNKPIIIDHKFRSGHRQRSIHGA